MKKKIESIVFNNTKYNKIINLSYESGKAFRLEDANQKYSQYLKSLINKSIKIKKLKVVLDCGNGATYNIAPNLLIDLGCKVITINDKPNGKNINLNCGAIDTKKLSKKVLLAKADIGFAFDGDGDRLIVVDEKGNEIDGDNIIALFARNLLSSKKLKKNTVVTTVMSNLGFEIYLKEKLGVKLIRENVGDINVISNMKKNSYNLGGEQSGHIILGQYMNTGDAILAAIKVIESLSKSNTKASKLFNLFKKFPQNKRNIKLNTDLSKLQKNKIKNISLQYVKKYKNLRFLVRKSGTEPLVRILVEGREKLLVTKITSKLMKELKEIISVK